MTDVNGVGFPDPGHAYAIAEVGEIVMVSVVLTTEAGINPINGDGQADAYVFLTPAPAPAPTPATLMPEQK